MHAAMHYGISDIQLSVLYFDAPGLGLKRPKVIHKLKHNHYQVATCKLLGQFSRVWTPLRSQLIMHAYSYIYDVMHACTLTLCSYKLAF